MRTVDDVLYGKAGFVGYWLSISEYVPIPALKFPVWHTETYHEMQIRALTNRHTVLELN